MVDDTNFLKSTELFAQTSAIVIVPVGHDDVVHADHTDGHIDH
jgi:hypothetical protein